MDKPIIALSDIGEQGESAQITADGQSFSVHEWSGSGPTYQHVHYSDDEAWHILEGTLTFMFGDREVKAAAGSTVFVPAGVAHSYSELDGPSRYLIIMTKNLRDLIKELHDTPLEEHAEIMRRHDSEILDAEWS